MIVRPGAGRPAPGFTEFVTLMALMTSMVALSIDAMLPALAEIGTDLGARTINDTQAVITALLVGMAIGQVLYGPVSDSTGRKPPIYVGFGIFLAGCLLSMFARDFTTMLAGRFLQGLGVAGPRSVSIALIRDLHAGREMARVMSMIMSVFIFVPIAAPAVGQAILLVADWRMIFAFFVVLALGSLAWFAARLPESLPVDRREDFSLRTKLNAARSVVTNRAAVGFTFTAGISSGAFVGYLASSRQSFQDVYGVGELFSVYFAVLAASIGLAAFLNGRLVMRYGMYPLTRRALVALAVLCVAFFGYSLLRGGRPELWAFMAWLMVSFFFVGVLFGNINALAMESLGEVAGIGAALVASGSLAISVVLGALIGRAFDGTVNPFIGGYAAVSLLSLPALHWAAGGRPAQD
jgi:DHA1 family bicyclomycin/chloramphenicol resistance-like MFS transporter